MFRELTPPETYAALAQDDDAILVDCRSPAEWHFTGMPDLSGIGKRRDGMRLRRQLGRQTVRGLRGAIAVIGESGKRGAKQSHRSAKNEESFEKL